jgi:hypothetical protein
MTDNSVLVIVTCLRIQKQSIYPELPISSQIHGIVLPDRGLASVGQ